MLSYLRWLSAGAPTEKKHTTLLHPLTTFLLHYCLVSVTVVFAHDALIGVYTKNYDVSNTDCSKQHSTTNTAHFLAVYFICFFAWRLFIHRNDPPFFLYCEFYKQTFLCSGTIFNAALAYYLDRPIIATAFCVAVGIDQVLWYIDLAAYFTWYVDLCDDVMIFSCATCLES
jgi:hypothetical protein